MRLIIATYMKDMYKKEIIANESGHDSISIEKVFLFMIIKGDMDHRHDKLNNRTREIRHEISEKRTTNIIKKKLLVFIFLKETQL